MIKFTILRFIIAAFLFLVASHTQAVILWEETFDTGISGQSVSDAPIGWNRDYGDIGISSSPHAGWTGNAITASLATDDPENFGAASASVNLPSLPTSGLLTLSFQAWAHPGSYGSEIALFTEVGKAIMIQAWDNCCLHNVWGVVSTPSFSGSASIIEWYTESDSHRSEDVFVSLYVDYDSHLYWASWQGDSGTTESAKFTFAGDPQFTSLNIYMDKRGTGGVDIDWIKISDAIAPVPEPSTYALLLVGLITLFVMERKRFV